MQHNHLKRLFFFFIDVATVHNMGAQYGDNTYSMLKASGYIFCNMSDDRETAKLKFPGISRKKKFPAAVES